MDTDRVAGVAGPGGTGNQLSAGRFGSEVIPQVERVREKERPQ